MIQAMYFVLWLSTAGPQMEGVTQGSLGHPEDNQNTLNACSTIEYLRKDHPDARLYEIGGSGLAGCDWGCEQPISVVEVTCKESEETNRKVWTEKKP